MTVAQLAEYPSVVAAAPTLEKHFTDMLIHEAATAADKDAIADISKCRTLARIVRDLRAVAIEGMKPPGSKVAGGLKPLKRFANSSNNPAETK